MCTYVKMADNDDIDKSVIRQCVLHDLEVLPLVCAKCKVSVCSECLVNEHLNHTLNKVANVAREYRLMLDRELTDEAIKNLYILNEKVQSYSKDLQEHGEQVARSIKEHADALVERVRENEQIESEKARSLQQKYAQRLESVQQRATQCLHYKQVRVSGTSESTSLLPDLDIVAHFTNFKYLKDKLIDAVKECQYPFVYQPYSFEDLDVECSFGKVVEETDCLSDFAKDEDETDNDDTEESFYDCDGIPYCINGEQVNDKRIEEIVPITRNTAYMRNWSRRVSHS